MKELFISGASPMLMPSEGPAQLIFDILLLLFLLACFVALMTFVAAFLRSTTEDSKDAIQQTPVLAVLTGLVGYVAMGVLVAWLYSEAFIERLLETEMVAGFLAATIVATIVPLLLSLLGAPGTFSYIGDRIAALHGGDMSGLRRIVLGTFISALAALFPIIGWFLILPLLLATSFGAFLLARWRRLRMR